ncbi:MAG: diguanylate cyclase [Bacillota bacterium]
MRKSDIEARRNRSLREALSAALGALFLVQFATLIVHAGLTADRVFRSPHTFIGAVLSFTSVAALMYLTEREDVVLRKLPRRFLDSWGLVLVAIPFLFSLAVILLTGGPQSSFKFFLAVPVFVAAILRGRTWAMVAGIVAAAFVVSLDLTPKATGFLASDMVLVLLTVSLGWAFGGVTDAEVAYTAALEEMADRDNLTGLYNHRAFHERLHDAFEQALAATRPLTLIVGEIDNFKLYNDAYGHPRGDEVLAAVGRIFARAVGDRGFAARYGGEEFAVILPGLTAEAGCRLAEELRAAVENNSFPGNGSRPLGKLTMSFGVAAYPAHARDVRELLRHADHALYRARFATGNRIEVYSSVLDPLYWRLDQEARDTLNSIRTLVMVINAKDNYTFGHSERVAGYAARLAAAVGLPEAEIRQLTYGAYLHDIGKVEIDRAVLNKQGPLDPEEWEVMRQHPIWGSQLVEPIPFLYDLLPIIKYHHENYDGSGYPEGLKGEAIPIGARIVRIADSFDAMVTERPYGVRRTPQEACREILAGAGTLYDPELARTFVALHG